MIPFVPDPDVVAAVTKLRIARCWCAACWQLARVVYEVGAEIRCPGCHAIVTPDATGDEP
jgi:hypothetical protein